MPIRAVDILTFVCYYKVTIYHNKINTANILEQNSLYFTVNKTHSEGKGHIEWPKA